MAARASAIAFVSGPAIAGRARARDAEGAIVVRSGNAWLRVQPGEVTLSLSAGRGAEDSPPIVVDGSIEVLDGLGSRVLPLVEAVPTPDGSTCVIRGGDDGAWTVQATVSPEPDQDGLLRCELKLNYDGETPTLMAARLRWRLAGAPAQSWMVPGAFYGIGSPDGYRGHPYPRIQAGPPDLERMVADRWGFRVDHASHPAVLAWSERGCAGLATDPGFGGDLAGVDFGVDGVRPVDASWLGLSFPWEEVPERYTLYPPGRWGGPAGIATLKMAPGDAVAMTTWLYLAEPDPYAFDPLLRWQYARLAPDAELRPWFGDDRAAALAAEGMMRWHAAKAQRVFWESVAFTAYQPGRPLGERRLEHVGWVDGVPTALALARYARTAGDNATEQFALTVIDRIATEAPTPHGLFWSAWNADAGWGTGWSPQPGWIQARTVAEAAQFLLQAAAEEAARGKRRPKWEQAAMANLSFAARAQRSDGNFGSYYDAKTGQVADWKGSAGLRWISALVDGWRHSGDARFLEAARKGGDYYAAAVEGASLYGAPEDADLTPSSEDGYVALRAYRALAGVEAPDSPLGDRWSGLARKAADWLITFRFAWNVPFAPDTVLGGIQFATRGGDVASARNQHLHAYGLISLSDLLELWEETRDRYYLERARDNLLCFRQAIARFDGDFGAGKGMMTEQWYHVDWMALKGGMLAQAHVWPLSMVLHGWWALRQFGNLVIDGRDGYGVLLAPGALSVQTRGDGSLLADISNSTGDPLPIRARIVGLDITDAIVDGAPVRIERVGEASFISMVVPPGAARRLILPGA